MPDLVLSGGLVLRGGAWAPGDLVCRAGSVADGPAEPGAEVVDVSGRSSRPGSSTCSATARSGST